MIQVIFNEIITLNRITNVLIVCFSPQKFPLKFIIVFNMQWKKIWSASKYEKSIFRQSTSHEMQSKIQCFQSLVTWTVKTVAVTRKDHITELNTRQELLNSRHNKWPKHKYRSFPLNSKICMSRPENYCMNFEKDLLSMQHKTMKSLEMSNNIFFNNDNSDTNTYYLLTNIVKKSTYLDMVIVTQECDALLK